MPHTVVETPAFIKAAGNCMTDEEREGAIAMVAENPRCGDLVRGTGGIRKVRYAVGSKGKSGGVRVMYFYAGAKVPIFMLSVFAKSSTSNLTKAQRNALTGVAKRLVDNYQE